MKILLVTNMYPSRFKSYGGLFLKNQYEELLRWKNDTDHIEYFYMKRILSNRLISFFKYLLAGIQFLPNLFKRYDLLHLHFIFPLFIPVMLYRMLHPSTKIIFTWHGSDINNFFNNRVSKWVYHKMCNNRIDMTIAVGNDLKSQIEEKLHQPVDLILSAGVNHHTFYPEPETTKKYDFIFVGDFNYTKGVPQLIEAIKMIDHGNYRFCFCGYGALEKEIKSLSTQYVEIELFRNVPQEKLRTLYSAARFMIIPSNYEPFGLVASEAIFCGTPTIVSPNGGLPAQIEHGKNGFILPAVTPEDVYETLIKADQLSPHQYSKMAEYTRASNHAYRLDEIAKKTLSIYKEMVKVYE